MLNSLNLETNPILKAKLKQFGFKKKSDRFARMYGESVQELVWGYATYSQKGIRDYSCTYYITFPQISDLAKELDELLPPIGGHIGYLLPQRDFRKWRVWGSAFSFAIGIPSIISAGSSEENTSIGCSNHRYFWTEKRANRKAADYFGKYYGINWLFSGYPIGHGRVKF